MPVVIALIFIGVVSFVPEPQRQRLNALLIAGAGGIYISGGGFGLWELAFAAVMVAVAWAGLRSWTFIGIGWLLHTAWDILHHRRGTPLIPSLHDSSFGCAICDPVIALWCFAGGRSPKELILRVRSRRFRSRRSTSEQSGSHPATGQGSVRTRSAFGWPGGPGRSRPRRGAGSGSGRPRGAV
ncbi:DUF6010 family protein [Paractinoplanes ovalisporus]|uniref:DUF6010 family protein n=1 Tax=Paractinoplanes ovalisporus TaxID=2810368 RepID=UPI001F1E8226|nr:DUF6010 family protein [Actinoplanes ovalisporus]